MVLETVMTIKRMTYTPICWGHRFNEIFFCLQKKELRALWCLMLELVGVESLWFCKILWATSSRDKTFNRNRLNGKLLSQAHQEVKNLDQGGAKCVLGCTILSHSFHQAALSMHPHTGCVQCTLREWSELEYYQRELRDSVVRAARTYTWDLNQNS